MKILETQYGEDFVGRDTEVQDLKSKIRNNGVVVLTGNRGIGKTNLMRVLEEFFKDERECHYIESGSLFSTEMSRYFLPEKVETGASHSATLLGVGGGAGRSWSLREETILEGMEKSEEMIVFVENAHELRKEDLEIIFAGTGRNNKLKFVLEIARPYYNDADLKITPEQLIELGKLGDGEIGKIVGKECPDFTEEVVKIIVSHSIGYPYIARSLAYICEKKESETEMLDFLNTLKDKDMELTLNKIHKGVLATLDKEARELIKKLALAPPVLTLPLIEAFCGDDADTPLGEVIERGILREDRERYSIYHPIFRDYLRKSQRISQKNKNEIYSEAMENIKSESDSIILLFDVINEPDIFKELIEIAEKYEVLNSIGNQIYIWGNISEANLALSRLLKVATSTKDNRWISIATCNLGNIYQIQGDMKKAQEYYEQALAIDEKTEDKNGKSSNLGNIGNVYQIQGDMKKAREYYEQALAIDEEVGDKQGIASHLGNIGILYQMQGDMRKAQEYYEQALVIDEEIGNKQGMASHLGNIDILYQAQGDIEKALEHYEKTLVIHDEVGNKQGMANPLVNMGIVYQKQGDIEKALEHYKKALVIDEEMGNKRGIAIDLGNIGIVYQKQGNIEKALEYYEKALVIDGDIGEKQGIASHLTNIATIYQKQGDIQKVLEYLKKAHGIFKDIGNKPDESQALMNIGLIYINKGEKSTALDYYLDAQDIAIDYVPHLFDEISERVNELLETQ